MPVLARGLEAAGFSTILVTMMPVWAERIGVPRTLAVEFPFAQTLGQPGNLDQQRRVILQAVEALENIPEAGTIVHSPEVWPQPLNEAIKLWQPPQPSPIIKVMVPRIREFLRARRSEE